MADIVVKAKNIHKQFRPPHQVSSVKSLFTSLFKNKRHHAKPHIVLDGVDLEIKKGEFFGIVGRNGSGKSTLLKILAGIYQPTKGTLNVHGRLVPFIELGVGFNPELTGKDNVYLNGAILGFSRSEIDGMYESIVEFAELAEFMDEKLKNYSSGMQVRLAFSMAIRADADILLIDEVLAVGDASFQKKCYDYFFELKKTGKTVIFISHDMDAIRTYCDRVMVLDGGKQQFTGSVSEATERYFKLFRDEDVVDGQDGLDRASGRWGDGSVRIEKTTQSQKDGRTYIETLIVVASAIELLNVGISVKDLASNEVIFGTNTEHSGQPLRNLVAGQKINIHWGFPNILRDGIYVVDVAAHGRAGLPVFDWLNGALRISYKNGRRTPYVVSPEIGIDMEITD